MTMNEEQRQEGAKWLRRFAQQVADGEADWFAITMKYPNYRSAMHTVGAPARPRGLS